MRVLRRALIVGCCGWSAVATAESIVRVGGEFQVNTYTPSVQKRPSVAVDAKGDFVVAWGSNQDLASEFGVFGQRFSSAGARLGGELQINAYTLSNQLEPSAAAESNGDFVVVWQSYNQDGHFQGVFGSRFASSGVRIASEFQVNVNTVGFQRSPAVAADANGDFVVAWLAFQSPNDGVLIRRFASSGSPLIAELRVSNNAINYDFRPAVATDPQGDFVVAWTRLDTDGSDSGVFARRYDSAGTVLGATFQVNVYTPDHQWRPAVAMEDDGDFLITWSSEGQDGSLEGIFARRFSSAGAALGAEFRVNSLTPGYHAAPVGIAQGASGFIVAWQDYGNGDFSVLVRCVDAEGVPQGNDLQANAFTTGKQYAVAIGGEGNRFVVTWTGAGAQDGSSYGVFAQRFMKLGNLDVDGNGSTDPLSDGLLTVRYHFGFTGATLVDGALGAGCTRCTPEAILAYLQSQD